MLVVLVVFVQMVQREVDILLRQMVFHRVIVSILIMLRTKWDINLEEIIPFQ
ncbi:hypothetical protein D3C71_2143170 [compost metagenome]